MHEIVASSAKPADPNDPDLPQGLEPNAPMELTADEAVEFAAHILYTGTGPDAAEALLRSVLKMQPEHARAIELLGVTLDEMGENDEAVALIEHAATLSPDSAGTFNNLGNAYVHAGQIDQALAAYERAVALDPNHAPPYCNLGIIYRSQQRYEEAEASLKRAIELDEKHHNAWFQLGNLYFAQGRKREGIDANVKAISLYPRHVYSNMLAQAYIQLGDVDQARHIYLDWAAREPDNPVPAFQLQTFLEKPPERCNDEYVTAVFNQFSSSFDAKLKNLNYRAPDFVAQALANVRPVADGTLDVLDAGCGTGWCGADLKPYARSLTGVDLSAGMIKQAEKRGVYDEFVVAELTEYLRTHPDAYDHITICDTFCYFGDMTAPAKAAFGALRPGGTLIATFEADEDTQHGGTFGVMYSGRYKHAGDYVDRAFEGAGLRVVERSRKTLREEFGHPVIGWVLTVQKPV